MWRSYFSLYRKQNQFKYIKSNSKEIFTKIYQWPFTEKAVLRCSTKWVFLKILQNSQENTRVTVFIKKEAPEQVLSVNFVNFLRKHPSVYFYLLSLSENLSQRITFIRITFFRITLTLRRFWGIWGSAEIQECRKSKCARRSQAALKSNKRH